VIYAVNGPEMLPIEEYVFDLKLEARLAKKVLLICAAHRSSPTVSIHKAMAKEKWREYFAEYLLRVLESDGLLATVPDIGTAIVLFRGKRRLAKVESGVHSII